MANSIVLVDTVKWIDHAKEYDEGIGMLRSTGRLGIHDDTLVEYGLGALGPPIRRKQEMSALTDNAKIFPHISNERVVDIVVLLNLGGAGIGYVDLQIFVTAYIEKISVYTRDNGLLKCCRAHGVELFTG